MGVHLRYEQTQKRQIQFQIHFVFSKTYIETNSSLQNLYLENTIMMLNLSSIGYTTQYLLAEKHLPKVKNSHVLEFLAALLGYGSYAAYKTESSKHLHRPQYLILQPDFAIERCKNFFDAQTTSDIAIDSLVAAIETDHAGLKVYKDEMFFLDYLAEYAQDEVEQSDEIGLVMAETNFFYGGFEVDDTDYIPFSLSTLITLKTYFFPTFIAL